MDTNRIKGTIDELVGSAKRKAGEVTGDGQLQIQGMVQQVKGKVENAWGKAKGAVREANEEAAIEHETRIDVEVECAATEAASEKNP